MTVSSHRVLFLPSMPWPGTTSSLSRTTSRRCSCGNRPTSLKVQMQRWISLSCIHRGSTREKLLTRLAQPLKHLLLVNLHTGGECLNQDWNLSSQFMAYKYYLKSAERGHIRGAIHLADIWTTGIPHHVRRRASDAVLLVIYVICSALHT